MKKIILFLVLSAGLILSASAQDAGNEEDVARAIHSPFHLSIRANALIPHPMFNPAFKRSFDGVYDATLSINAQVYKGFTLGLMYKNSEFQIPANKIAKLYTKEQYNIAGVRLGYDYFLNKISVISAGLSAGQCQMFAYDVLPTQPGFNAHPTDQGFYLEPEFCMSFYTEDDFAIGFNLSYEIITAQFDPYKLALDQHGISYNPSDLKGFTQNISIGFHFVYSFWKMKKK